MSTAYLSDAEKYRQANPEVSKRYKTDYDLSWRVYKDKIDRNEIASDTNFLEFNENFLRKRKPMYNLSPTMEQMLVDKTVNLLDFYKTQRSIRNKWTDFAVDAVDTVADVFSTPAEEIDADRMKYIMDGVDISPQIEAITGEVIPDSQKASEVKVQGRAYRQALKEKKQIWEASSNKNSLLPDTSPLVTGHPTFIKKLWAEAFKNGDYNKSWKEFINDPEGLDVNGVNFSLNSLPTQYKKNLIKGLIDENERPLANFDVSFSGPKLFSNQALDVVAGDLAPFALTFLASKKVLPTPSFTYLDDTISSLKKSKTFLAPAAGNILKGVKETTKALPAGEATVQLLFDPYDESIVNAIGSAMATDEESSNDLVSFLSRSDTDSVATARMKLFAESVGLSYALGGVAFPVAGSSLKGAALTGIYTVEGVSNVLKKYMNPKYEKMLAIRDENGKIIKEDLLNYAVMFNENSKVASFLGNILFPMFKSAGSLTPKQADIVLSHKLGQRETEAMTVNHISYIDEAIDNLFKSLKNNKKFIKIGNKKFKNSEEIWEELVNIIGGKRVPKVLPKSKLEWTPQKVGSKADNNRRTIYNTEIYDPKSKKSFKYTLRQAIDPEDQGIVPNTWQIVKTELTGKKRSRVIQTYKSLSEAKKVFPKKINRTNVAKLIPDVDFKYAHIENKLKGFPNEIKNNILLLRNIIDSLSMSVLKMPHSHLSNEINAVMKRNLGSYMREQYEIYKNPNYKPTPEAYNTWVKELAETNFSKLKSEEAIIQAKAHADNILETYRPKKASSSDFLTDLHGFHSEISTLDKSFIKRKKLTPAAKEFLGYINDPRSNILETVTRLGNLKRAHGTFNDILEAGENVIFFKNKPSDPRFQSQIGLDIKTLEQRKKIAEKTGKFFNDTSAAYGPLQGYYTSPSMAATMEKVVNLNSSKVVSMLRTFSESEGFWGNTYRLLLANKTYHNYNATVLNNVTHVRNFTAGPLFLLNNGHVVPDIKATKMSIDAVTNNILKLNDKELNAYFARLQGQGVINTSVEASFLTDSIRLATKSGSLQKWIDNKTTAVAKSITGKDGTKVAPADAISKAAQKARDVYVAEDNFWKIAYYEIEKKAWKKAHPTWTNERIERTVADIVRNTIPNYDMIPAFWDALKYIPFGQFWSFKYEQFRVSTNAVILGAQQLKSNNPEIRKMGAKRLAGALTTSNIGAAGISHEASKLIYGISPSQDWAINEVSANWYKNKRNVYYRDPETGQLEILAADYNDAFGDVNRINNNLIHKQFIKEDIDIDEFKKTSLKLLFDELLGQSEAVFGVDIGTTVLKEALYDGKDSLGKDIWTDLSPDGSKSLWTITNWMNSLAHIAKASQPTFYKNYKAVVESKKYDNTELLNSKKDFENKAFAQYSGLNWREFNAEKSISSSLFAVRLGRSNVKETLKNKLKEKDRTEAYYVKAYESYLKDTMRYNSKLKKILTASSILGFSPNAQLKFLKDASLGNETQRKHFVYNNTNFSSALSPVDIQNILKSNPDLREVSTNVSMFKKSFADSLMDLHGNYHGLLLINFDKTVLFSDQKIATEKIDERIPNMLGDIEFIKRDPARFNKGKILKRLNKKIGGEVSNVKDNPEDRSSKYLGESFFETTRPSLRAILEKRNEVINEQRETNRRA